MTTILEATEAEQDKAQAELAQAEIAAIEATARLEDARSASDRLNAAVAALKGETPAEPPVPSEIPASDISEVSASRQETADMTPEQFDAHRKKRQRERQKELDANNPLAQYKCGGCGSVGTSSEQILTASSGAPIRFIGCSACGNQTF